MFCELGAPRHLVTPCATRETLYLLPKTERAIDENGTSARVIGTVVVWWGSSLVEAMCGGHVWSTSKGGRVGTSGWKNVSIGRRELRGESQSNGAEVQAGR